MARIAEIEGHTCCTRDQLFYQLDMGQIDGQWFAHELRALRDALFTAPSNGSQRVGGGCSICGAMFSCDCAAKVSPSNWQCITCDAPVGKPCWVEPLAGNSCTLHYHGARLHIAHLRANELRAIERGFTELRDASAVAAPGVACEWDLSDAEEK